MVDQRHVGSRPAALGPLAAAGVLAVTTAALGAALLWAGEMFGARSVAFAFAVNWIVMSWLGIAGRLYPPSLPARYFEIRPFEASGRLYEALGVRMIKYAVRRGPLHVFKRHLRLPEFPDARSLRRLERRMREPEAAHVCLFLFVMLLVVAHALVRGWWTTAVWTMLFNVLLNAYPVMLQRYNRRWLLDRATAADGSAQRSGHTRPR